jgi:DNA-binding CsgD family transcriptional regulator
MDVDSMEENVLLSPIYQTRSAQVLKNHLRHILNTTLVLLNLEHCTLSLVTENDGDALSVCSSLEPASTVQESRSTVRSANANAEESFQFRLRLELGSEKSRDADLQLTNSSSSELAEHDHVASIEQTDIAAPFIKLWLVRKTRFGRLTYTERNAIQRVLQSINRTIACYIDHRPHDYHASILERLLAYFCIGVIQLDRNLDIVEKSNLVDELLATTDSYRCQSNRLMKIAPQDDHIVERAVDTLKNHDLPYCFVDVVSTLNKGQCAIVVAKLASESHAPENGYLVYVLCSAADQFEANDLLNFWHITPAEKRVLAGLTRYGSIKKVAIELGISPNTVKSQVKSAYKKLGVDNKISLLRRFSVLRLIDALTSNSR